MNGRQPADRFLIREIPAMNEILNYDWISTWLEKLGRTHVKRVINAELSRVRQNIIENDAAFSPENFRLSCIKSLAGALRNSLKRVINATGVIIHTNLGRSLISESAVKSMSLVATGYSNLEYDLENGTRGQRNAHIEGLMCSLTGAEAAFAVNNNAGAVLLSLCALSKNTEVVVSRGELVEIGGSFRIPDIMELSGAKLVEVGTTNRTHLYDYERAINERTSMLMKIHPSNFRIEGFTSSPERKALSRLAHDNGLIFMEDAGSGLLADIKLPSKSSEITINACLEAGADIVTFSGDKMLGGPQIGGIVGKKKYIDVLKKYPLARALRVDKVTLAAFEETLRLYMVGEYDKIPTLRMLNMNIDDIKSKALELSEILKTKLKADVNLIEVSDAVGGGSCPEIDLDGWGISIGHKNLSASYVQKLLRSLDVPVICGACEDRIVIHVRTLQDNDFDILVKSLEGVYNA